VLGTGKFIRATFSVPCRNVKRLVAKVYEYHAVTHTSDMLETWHAFLFSIN
jgi:hypothetical protein